MPILQIRQSESPTEVFKQLASSHSYLVVESRFYYVSMDLMPTLSLEEHS